MEYKSKNWPWELHTPKEVEDLCECARQSFQDLSQVRTQRADMISDCVGTEYVHSNKSSKNYTLLNVQALAEQAHVMMLAAEQPQCIATTKSKKHLAFSARLTRAVNHYAKLLNLNEALQDATRNSYHGLGIIRVYEEEALSVDIEADQNMEPNAPACISVSPHHHVYDTAASAIRHCSFMGHRYLARKRTLINRLREQRVVPEDFVRKLDEYGLTPYNSSKDEWGRPFKQTNQQRRSFMEKVYLADIFLPVERVTYTFVADSEFNLLDNMPIHMQPWNGREEGPYHYLNMGPVPDKIEPVPPALRVQRLGNLVNSVGRKLENMAQAMKEVYVGINDDKVDALRASEHGDALADVDANDLQPLRYGGPDNQLTGYWQIIQELFDTMAGSPRQRLGLGTAAGTATQEEIISANSSQYAGYQYGRYHTFVKGIVEEIARILWESNSIGFAMSDGIQGAPGTSVSTPWEPKDRFVEIGNFIEPSRQGDFDDYDIDLIPFSGNFKPNSQRAMELQQSWQEINQLAPMLAADGKMPDFMYYQQRKAELLSNPDLNHLIRNMPLPPEQQVMMAQGGGQQQNGGRYIHESNGNGSGSGQQPPTGQQLLAAPNPSEGSQIG